MTITLKILEIDYSVSPGGINSFEVYDGHEDVHPMSPPIFETEDLTEAVKFCYDLGQDFSVLTLASYYAQEALNV
jgi:predicted amidohydrolase